MSGLLIITIGAVVANIHAIPSIDPFTLTEETINDSMVDFNIQPREQEHPAANATIKEEPWCIQLDLQYCDLAIKWCPITCQTANATIKEKPWCIQLDLQYCHLAIKWCPITCQTVPVVPACGQVNRVHKIVGGVETEVHEYPWQVGLAWSISSTRPFCGGSIINERWILTAAHCAVFMLASTNIVVVGEHSWSTESETAATEKYAIEEILVHPDYNSITMDIDIALIKLAEPLIFDSNNKVAPACPPNPNELYEDVDTIVTGWGSFFDGGSSPDSLHEVVVPSMPNCECQSAYEGHEKITDNMICAALPEGGKDSCKGDSGGPMITADGSIYRQIGVVSWGYNCARPEFPGVYARITSQMEWITDSISGTSWSEPNGF